MDLGTPPAVWLAAGALLLGLVALAVAALSLAGQRRVRRAYRAFSRGGRGGPRDDVLSLLHSHIGEVGELRAEVAKLEHATTGLRDLMRCHISRVGTVHYDAFDDMGGQLSFSTALLDEHSDGLVLTSINGRTETRTYVKQLTGGSSGHNLSTEEREAIDRAQASIERRGDSQAAASSRGGARPGSRPRRRGFLTRT